MQTIAKFQRALITVLIAVGFFYGGLYYGARGYDLELKKNPPKINFINKTQPNQDIDFQLFWDVWNIASTNYLNRPVDSQKMFYGAISGMIESLEDPYSVFLAPELNEAINGTINNTYQGIGAELDIRDEQLMIIAPLDGSPAKAAGIIRGDKILEINGESTLGITITEAVIKIRGDAGTSVTLKISRDGVAEPFDVEIKRGVIKVDSVTWEDKGDGTAYIRISRFGESLNDEWDKVVKEVNVRMAELDAIIIDVRGNPGGYLLSPVHIAGDFYTGKPVVIQQDATGEETVYDADKKNGVFIKIPKVFVLIDKGSASASEILAAALKENIDATLIGETSFGKGTIQNALDFKDGSGIHITYAKWLTPNKQWVHKTGLEPDIKVEAKLEDIQQSIDAQLDKAVELAKEI